MPPADSWIGLLIAVALLVGAPGGVLIGGLWLATRRRHPGDLELIRDVERATGMDPDRLEETLDVRRL